jgi:HD-GYP domain-containing protein (c-di-GMP phosphodiesterase class II)
VAVADAFHAMTSNRPYRPAMSKEYAIEELERYSGTQFDPQVARTMLGIIGSNT